MLHGLKLIAGFSVFISPGSFIFMCVEELYVVFGFFSKLITVHVLID